MISLGRIQMWEAEFVRKKMVCTLVWMLFSNRVLRRCGNFVGRGRGYHHQTHLVLW